MIVLKSAREIARMRDAGQVVARAIDRAASLIRPGIATRALDAAIEDVFRDAGAQALFKGVPGKVPFPAASCISVNDEVVHGIPGERILNAGDLVSIDTACRLAGWCADSAWTFPVGAVDETKSRLLSVGQSVLALAITEIGRCSRWSEVAALMSDAVHKAGFSGVEDLVGHGIGREMHEDPQVPNYVSESLRQADFALEPGLVLAIEPMINAGSRQTRTSKKDHWTVRTEDGQPSVHFEHSVALTSAGPVILTLPDGPRRES
ncbi:MAG TPA: type I methionyl aminopeptidase [Planctomycetaceae bacterium]|nr:type I methionyl aminopeptidase [Planctomycetaceae bacterium]